jgi:hypothetical protein
MAANEVPSLTERRRRRFEVKWTETKPKKPILPDLPTYRDLDGQRAWMTAVLHLDPKRPIVGGTHSGLAGGRGHITLDRLDAPAIEFNPASRIGKGDTLGGDLVWQLDPSDGEPYPWTNLQATKIARVVRLMCDASRAVTSRQETVQILTTYIEAAEEVEGNTYGTTGERYEAAVLLRPELDEHGNVRVRRYLIDTTKPMIVIRVSDLAHVARQVTGSTLAHGWLDAQIDRFGWERARLQGQSIHGREGRVRGRHGGADVYRGLISSLYDAESEVNT